MKISALQLKLIKLLLFLCVAGVLLTGLAMPQWLASVYIGKQNTFYALAVLFFCYSLALAYASVNHQEDNTQKALLFLRAPIYFCISGFCFYYAHFSFSS